MNTLSVVKMSVEPLSTGFTNHTLPLKTDSRLAEFNPVRRSVPTNGIGSGEASSAAMPKLRLGENVRHGRHGTGRVLAHWPDGTVLVRFDDMAKNQLIWPSFLDRANGQRR